jgi:hypothetical protein
MFRCTGFAIALERHMHTYRKLKAATALGCVLIATTAGVAGALDRVTIPTEKPIAVTIKVIVTGSSADRVASAFKSCGAAFAEFKTGKLVAPMGAAVSDFVGWTPGKVPILAPDFLKQHRASEGVALCYVDGQLGSDSNNVQRALYLIGEDGTPVLYAVGSLRDLLVANPSVKLGRKYVEVPKESPPPANSIPLQNDASKRGSAPSTIPDENNDGKPVVIKSVAVSGRTVGQR